MFEAVLHPDHIEAFVDGFDSCCGNNGVDAGAGPPPTKIASTGLVVIVLSSVYFLIALTRVSFTVGFTRPAFIRHTSFT
jgi:hypothetical protein